MYELTIDGQSIPVRDWCEGIKIARTFQPRADYARSEGDYEVCLLGGGAIGMTITAGRNREPVGMVIRR